MSVTEQKPEVKSNPIDLGTVRKGPTKNYRDQKFLMLGPGKSGKSEFWSQGKQTVFIETEAGLNHLDVNSYPCRNWDDIRSAVGKLIKSKNHPDFPDTVVVDTMDRLVDRAIQEIVARGQQKFPKNEINGVGDIPNGLGWFWQSTMIKEFLGAMEQLPCALVLISHLKQQEVDEIVRKYNRWTISIGGQTGTGILHFVDHTIMLQCQQQGDKLVRTLRTKPTTAYEAGSRGGIIPDGMKWGNDARENYLEFRKLFD